MLAKQNKALAALSGEIESSSWSEGGLGHLVHSCEIIEVALTDALVLLEPALENESRRRGGRGQEQPAKSLQAALRSLGERVVAAKMRCM